MNKRMTRRGFLKKASLAGAAAGTLGFPGVLRAKVETPCQTQSADIMEQGDSRLCQVSGILQ